MKIMMSRLKQYKKEFNKELNEGNLIATFTLSFIALTGVIVHPLDILLGMDGLFDKNDRNSPYSAPIALVFSAIGGVCGFFIGSLIRFITIIPGLIGSMVDNVISRIFPSYKNLMSPITEKLNDWGFRTPGVMEGFFGFVAGIIPEIFVNLAHQIGGVIYSVVNVIMEDVNNGLRSIGKFLFGSKKTEATVVNNAQHSSATPSSTLHTHNELAKLTQTHLASCPFHSPLHVDVHGGASETRQDDDISLTVVTRSDSKHSPSSVDGLPHSDPTLVDGDTTQYSPSTNSRMV
jgi:hypothetical protein